MTMLPSDEYRQYDPDAWGALRAEVDEVAARMEREADALEDAATAKPLPNRRDRRAAQRAARKARPE
jgi:hypothetical protein